MDIVVRWIALQAEYVVASMGGGELYTKLSEERCCFGTLINYARKKTQTRLPLFYFLDMSMSCKRFCLSVSSLGGYVHSKVAFLNLSFVHREFFTIQDFDVDRGRLCFEVSPLMVTARQKTSCCSEYEFIFHSNVARAHVLRIFTF